MNHIDFLFVSIVTTFSLIGLFLNLLLLYMIVFKSPASLTPYRIFLANTTITQFVFAIFTLFSQPRVLTVREYTIVIYMGPVQFSGPWLSAMSYLGLLHLAWNSFISIMLSMVYRYFSINASRFSVRNSVLICILGLLTPLISYLACATIETTNDLATNQGLLGNLVDNLSQYNMVVATSILEQTILIIFVILVSVGLVPIYGVMYWCRYKIYRQLKETSTVQSSSTKNNVKRLVQALTIQSLIPLVSFFPSSIFYCLSQSGIVEPTIYSYFIVPCLLISCVADPLITMRCVLPYRRCVLRICKLQNRELTNSQGDRSRSDPFSRTVNKEKLSRNLYIEQNKW